MSRRRSDLNGKPLAESVRWRQRSHSDCCGAAIQNELHASLKERGLSAVSAGTVVKSGAGGLPFQFILHAVAIDPFMTRPLILYGRRFVRLCRWPSRPAPAPLPLRRWQPDTVL